MDDFVVSKNSLSLLHQKHHQIEKTFDVRISYGITSRDPGGSGDTQWLHVMGGHRAQAKEYIATLCNPEEILEIPCPRDVEELNDDTLQKLEKEYNAVILRKKASDCIEIRGTDMAVTLAMSAVDDIIDKHNKQLQDMYQKSPTSLMASKRLNENLERLRSQDDSIEIDEDYTSMSNAVKRTYVSCLEGCLLNEYSDSEILFSGGDVEPVSKNTPLKHGQVILKSTENGNGCDNQTSLKDTTLNQFPEPAILQSVRVPYSGVQSTVFQHQVFSFNDQTFGTASVIKREDIETDAFPNLYYSTKKSTVVAPSNGNLHLASGASSPNVIHVSTPYTQSGVVTEPRPVQNSGSNDGPWNEPIIYQSFVQPEDHFLRQFAQGCGYTNEEIETVFHTHGTSVGSHIFLDALLENRRKKDAQHESENIMVQSLHTHSTTSGSLDRENGADVKSMTSDSVAVDEMDVQGPGIYRSLESQIASISRNSPRHMLRNPVESNTSQKHNPKLLKQYFDMFEHSDEGHNDPEALKSNNEERQEILKKIFEEQQKEAFNVGSPLKKRRKKKPGKKKRLQAQKQAERNKSVKDQSIALTTETVQQASAEVTEDILDEESSSDSDEMDERNNPGTGTRDSVVAVLPGGNVDIAVSGIMDRIDQISLPYMDQSELDKDFIEVRHRQSKPRNERRGQNNWSQSPLKQTGNQETVELSQSKRSETSLRGPSNQPQATEGLNYRGPSKGDQSPTKPHPFYPVQGSPVSNSVDGSAGVTQKVSDTNYRGPSNRPRVTESLNYRGPLKGDQSPTKPHPFYPVQGSPVSNSVDSSAGVAQRDSTCASAWMSEKSVRARTDRTVHANQSWGPGHLNHNRSTSPRNRPGFNDKQSNRTAFSDPTERQLYSSSPQHAGYPKVLPRKVPVGAPRFIVIDGSNVAMTHGNGKYFSCKGIAICIDFFKKRGHTEIVAFVPMWRKQMPSFSNKIKDQYLLEELKKQGHLTFTPSRKVQGRNLVCYDDRFVIKLAQETEGVIVSNDNYRDLMEENEDWRHIIETRLLMFSFVGDLFMPPDDPLGRDGPSLDEFLLKPDPHAQDLGDDNGGQNVSVADSTDNQLVAPYNQDESDKKDSGSSMGGAQGRKSQTSSTKDVRRNSLKTELRTKLLGIFPDNSVEVDRVLKRYNRESNFDQLACYVLDTIKN